MIITDTRTQRPTSKNVWIQETSRRINPSKTQFRKFDPKTKLSLPYMGKKKVKCCVYVMYKCCVYHSQSDTGF